MLLKTLTLKIATLFLLVSHLFPIDIAFVCDNNYSHMLATCIFSILDNKDELDKINIYVLHPNFRKETIKKLNKICNKKCSIKYIKFDLLKFSGIRKDFHPMAYTKCLIPRLLPKLDKVLYLDVDTIIIKSLKELWETELGDNYVAAVQEFGNYEFLNTINLNYYRKKYKNKIKLMFNSGVMLLNLKKLREINFEEKFMHEVLHEKHYFGDQPIFFFLCLDHIKYLPPKWNAQTIGILLSYRRDHIIYSDKEISYVKNDPSIIHFFSKSYLNKDHKFYYLFMHYLYKIIPNKKEVRNLIKKFKNKNDN